MTTSSNMNDANVNNGSHTISNVNNPPVSPANIGPPNVAPAKVAPPNVAPANVAPVPTAPFQAVNNGMLAGSPVAHGIPVGPVPNAMNEIGEVSKKRKREANLLKWKWDEVIVIDDSDEDVLSMENVKRKKKNQVSIYSRNKIFRLYDEPDAINE